MKEFFNQYGIHLFTAVLTVFVSIVGWVIKEYYANQKKVDESQAKAVNGLGERVNRSLASIEKEIRDFRLEVKTDVKDVGRRVDTAIDAIHAVEKRLIIKNFEEEIKKVRESSGNA